MIKITSSKKNRDLFDDISKLSKIREALINDSVAKKICKEKKIGEWFLHGVPIKFEDIDASAKTVDSVIILNKKLKSKPFDIMMRYVIHELTHSIQHVHKAMGLEPRTNSDENYLDKDSEIEAFRYQIEFDKENRGKEKAEEYVEGLLDYHELEGKDREDKKDELLDEA